MSTKTPATDRGLTSRIGRVEIDWPRTAGYYGGIGIAVACGLIDPPLGLFIAAIPFLKMLNRPDASRASRLTGQLLDGAAQPVGGDGKGTITLVAPPRCSPDDRPPSGRKRAGSPIARRHWRATEASACVPHHRAPAYRTARQRTNVLVATGT